MQNEQRLYWSVSRPLRWIGLTIDEWFVMLSGIIPGIFLLNADAFLTGLLSLIDAILDESLESILEKLPLAQEIKDALTTKKGVLAALITLVKQIEHADWDKTAKVMEKLGLSKEKVVKDYNEAIAWADEQAQLAQA